MFACQRLSDYGGSVLAWVSGSDGSETRIAHVGFWTLGPRRFERIEQAVRSCLAEGELLVAFLPGPGHVLKGEVPVRRVSDAVVVTSSRLLFLGLRRGDVILVDEAPLGEVDVYSYVDLGGGPDWDGLELRVRRQRMEVLVRRRYAGRIEGAGRAISDARAKAHFEAVGRPRPVEASVCGQSFRLVVRVEDYEFPWKEPDEDEEYDPSAYWLYVTAWVKLPDGREHRMGRDPCLETLDVESFVDQLTVFVRERSGTAELSGIAAGFGVTIELSDGEGTINGWLADMEFHDIPTDLSRVQGALEQFTALAAAFPTPRPGR
jgi:hypothetical protein